MFHLKVSEDLSTGEVGVMRLWAPIRLAEDQAWKKVGEVQAG